MKVLGYAVAIVAALLLGAALAGYYLLCGGYHNPIC